MSVSAFGWVVAVVSGTGLVFLLSAIWCLRDKDGKDDSGRWN